MNARFKFRLLLIPLICGMIGVAVMSGGFSDQFVRYDDTTFIKQAPHNAAEIIRLFTDPEAVGEYHPLMYVSYYLDGVLFGPGPEGNKIGSYLIYFSTAFPLFFIGLFLAAGSKRQILIASLATFLFMVHPLHAEPVCWIAGRKDLLSGFLGFSSLLLFLISFDPENNRLRIRPICYLLIYANITSGNFERAYNLLSEHDPERSNPDYFRSWGSFFLSNGRPDLAIEQFSKAWRAGRFSIGQSASFITVLLSYTGEEKHDLIEANMNLALDVADAVLADRGDISIQKYRILVLARLGRCRESREAVTRLGLAVENDMLLLEARYRCYVNEDNLAAASADFQQLAGKLGENHPLAKRLNQLLQDDSEPPPTTATVP